MICVLRNLCNIFEEIALTRIPKILLQKLHSCPAAEQVAIKKALTADSIEQLIHGWDNELLKGTDMACFRVDFIQRARKLCAVLEPILKTRIKRSGKLTQEMLKDVRRGIKNPIFLDLETLPYYTFLSQCLLRADTDQGVVLSSSILTFDKQVPYLTIPNQQMTQIWRSNPTADEFEFVHDLCRCVDPCPS